MSLLVIFIGALTSLAFFILGWWLGARTCCEYLIRDGGPEIENALRKKYEVKKSR